MRDAPSYRIADALLGVVRIEMEMDASCKLVLFGRHVRREWRGEEFGGWGGPLSVLFTRDWPL